MKIETVVIDEKKIFNFFTEAKNEILYKNRFENEKLDKIVTFLINSQANKIKLRKNSIYYRARIYNEPDAQKKFLECRGLGFKGYDEENSFVNKNASTILDGRCNPRWISYLYISQSKACSIHEIKPNIGSYISVAQILVNENLKILDLSTETIAMMQCDFEDADIIVGIPNGALCQYLSRFFSFHHKSESDYLLTQYLSEKIKNRGYDGIAYKSSVYNGEKDINYVIFNYEKCKAISSGLVKIKSISIDYEINEKQDDSVE